MRLPSKIKFIAILISVFSAQHSFSEEQKIFRSPARLYAGAYSIKIQLKKGLIEYDVPVWVKPDQEESTIDLSLIRELGYLDKDISFNEVKISGQTIEKKSFKNQKTEWAFVPDFPKACCFGVIGRDILKDYEVRFDPQSHPHLVWKRLPPLEQGPLLKSSFITELKKLFSLNEALDLPFVLNLQKPSLEIEGTFVKPEPTIFSFFFLPPERVLKVMAILPKLTASAKKAGFTSGAVVTHINDERVSDLDRWVIEKYLRGEKGSIIKLTTKTKKEFSFDFIVREFK